jgi:elongation factor Ts
MAEVSAALVKELREKTGVGMMDCKKALTETGGDLEAAADWLRAKGLSKAAKKADRVAAEGLVGVATRPEGRGMVGAVVELNSETDFVARNEMFQRALGGITRTALDTAGTPEAILAARAPEGEGTVGDLVTHLVATIGENMTVRRAARLAVPAGVVASYVHSATTDGLGRIGVLVAIESEGPADALNDLGRRIAMHIAATQPQSLSVEDLSQDAIQRERAIFTEQARESGKPESVIEKMIEGRIRKFYEEVVLLKQGFVMDPDTTVEQLVAKAGKELGTPVKLTGFARLALGEGVEKKVEDFAAEVAAAAGAVKA